jgi:pimeloyl-ACP methyl ester carboxylesterase
MTESNVTRRGIIGGAAAGVGLAAAGASGDFVGAARAQSLPRTFVLIHGAFLGGWCWRRVSDLLEKKGHKVFSPTLTGLGERSHLLGKDINLDTHITDIVNVIKWEDIKDVCLVVHSYGGFVGSGVIEQIGSRVSSIVWLDAFKAENSQRPIDFTIEAFRKALLSSADRGEPGFAAPKLGPTFVNENDLAYVNSKLTAQPIGTYLQPIKLSGAREKVTKKTYVRALRYPSPVFDKALEECKADKSWSTFEIASGHIVMLDESEWLADILLQVS